MKRNINIVLTSAGFTNEQIKIQTKKVERLIRIFCSSLSELGLPSEYLELQILIVIYTHFLDAYIDETNEDRYLYVVIYLLNKINELIICDNTLSIYKFDNYLNKYNHYLYLERDNELSLTFREKYKDRIPIEKALPFLYICESINFREAETYQNFLKLMLLVDDIIDYFSDKQNGILTHVIINEQNIDKLKYEFSKLTKDLIETKSNEINKNINEIITYFDRKNVWEKLENDWNY